MYVEETDQLIRLDSNMDSTLGTFIVNHPEEGTVNKIDSKSPLFLSTTDLNKKEMRDIDSAENKDFK